MIATLGKSLVKASIWGSGKILYIFHRQKKITPRRIMIIRTDRIGDFVLFMPALKWVREKFHDSFLILVVQDVVSDLAKVTPSCDVVIGFNETKYKRNLFYRFAFLFRLFRFHAELCLCPVYSRDHITDEMALWSGASEKIAWDTKLPNMSMRELIHGKRIYSRLLTSSLGSWDHESERNREWLKLMQIPAADFLFPLMVQQESIIKNKGIEDLSKYKMHIAISVGAGAEYRKWGKTNFVILMRRLIQIRSDIGFVIIGNEYDRLDTVELGIGDLKANCLDLCGRFLLHDLFKVFSACQLVIGNESGPMHLAIASGVPTLTILGGGHFGRFMPYGDPLKNRFVYKKMVCFQCNWHCIYPQTRCIGEISVDDVLYQAAAMLSPSDVSPESPIDENDHPSSRRK